MFELFYRLMLTTDQVDVILLTIYEYLTAVCTKKHSISLMRTAFSAVVMHQSFPAVSNAPRRGQISCSNVPQYR